MSGPTYDFAGQVALVTGAGSGMGSPRPARSLAGASVALADVDEDALRAATDELTAPTRRSPSPATSPTKPRSPPLSSAPLRHSAASTWPSTTRHPGAAERHGRRADRDLRAGERDQLRGAWAHGTSCGRCASKGRAIVNCSSLGGLVGLPGRAAYHASKHGVLDHQSALEYASRRPHQRGLPRNDRHADGRCDGGQRRARHGRGAPQPADRPPGTADEIAAGGPLALQPRASWSASRYPSTAATPPPEEGAPVRLRINVLTVGLFVMLAQTDAAPRKGRTRHRATTSHRLP